jgi:hypothetical protein
MRKLLFPTLGLGLLLLGMPLLAQEVDPRGILDKAVKAHGGESVLSKNTASHARSKGKIHLGGGLEFIAEEDVQFPDKFKSVVQFEINGMNVSVTQVFDGKQGWVSTMDKTVDLDDKAVEEIKEILHATRVGNLVAPLKDPKFKLAGLGEAKVKDRDAVGVRVSYEGRRDVNLYFDKASGMLVKTEGRALDPISKQEVNQAKFFSDYRDVEGRKSPRKVEIRNDDKAFLDLEIVELRLLDKHDESTFKMP